MPALQQSGASGLPQQPEGALLQEQLGYFQTWLVSLSRTPLQAVALASVQSAVRVVVSGFSDTTSAEVGPVLPAGRVESHQHVTMQAPAPSSPVSGPHPADSSSSAGADDLLPADAPQDLRNTFEGLMAAYHAAVAPGKVVQGANIQPGSPASAVLQLRCSVEASNCLAFDGVACNGAVLKVIAVVLVKGVRRLHFKAHRLRCTNPAASPPVAAPH